jgi:hypothetical protein
LKNNKLQKNILPVIFALVVKLISFFNIKKKMEAPRI